MKISETVSEIIVPLITTVIGIIILCLLPNTKTYDVVNTKWTTSITLEQYQTKRKSQLNWAPENAFNVKTEEITYTNDDGKEQSTLKYTYDVNEWTLYSTIMSSGYDDTVKPPTCNYPVNALNNIGSIKRSKDYNASYEVIVKDDKDDNKQLTFDISEADWKRINEYEGQVKVKCITQGNKLKYIEIKYT